MRIAITILLLLFQLQFVVGQEDYIQISDDKLYGEIQNGLPKNDTIVELKSDGIIIGKGAFAVNKYGVSNLKVGYWKEYTKSGSLKMEGNYKLGSYIGCCTGGACRSFYYYRDGIWKFYDNNSELQYKLNFKPTELHIDTTCEGGDKLIFGTIESIPLEYLGNLTSDKVFELQRIRKENDNYISSWTPLNGRIFIETIKKKAQ